MDEIQPQNGAGQTTTQTQLDASENVENDFDFSGDPRLHVCQAPNAFICVSPCGSILGPFWVHFGSILGPFGVQESVFRQESTTRQESVFRQECSLDKNSSLDC